MRHGSRPQSGLPMLGLAMLGVAALAVPLLGAPRAMAEECCDPAGPFRLGEAYADVPATCETLAGWLEQAPAVEGRVSMTVRGPLAAVESDGTLAYLVMCPEAATQVMCITYSTNDMKPGETVLFAGGYARVGPRQVMLDPCLATRG